MFCCLVQAKKSSFDAKPESTLSPSKEVAVEFGKEKPKANTGDEKSLTSKHATPAKSTPEKPKGKAGDADFVPPSLEKKSSAYRSFMMREGPQALGSKEIPKVL